MKRPSEIFREVSDDGLVVRLDIVEDHDCLRGHFPGFPILPGVVQLYWAVEIAREYFGFSEAVCDIRRLKFKNIVSPPAVVTLELVRTGEDEARFVYFNSGATFSQGRLAFAGPLE